MHPNVLRKILQGALTASAVTGAGCGCFMGRAYGPSTGISLDDAPASVKSAMVAADGTLDKQTCIAVCGRDAVSCEIASADPKLRVRPLAEPRTMVCECRPAGWTRAPGVRYQELAPEDAVKLHPDAQGNIDPQNCRARSCCGDDDTVALVSCSLDPPDLGPRPLSPDDRFVVCHLYHPGGCDFGGAGGRAFAGLVPPSRADDTVGGFFARAAYMERASIDAFRVLARELAAEGAPRTLVRRAQRSARDEAKHARVTAAIARRFGARPERPRSPTATSRSFFDIARENAVEGCVRETFAAVVVMFQARAARDSDVRARMSEIAKDETRHAALAWDVHAWCMRRLSPAERAAIRRSMRAAERGLSRLGVSAPVREIAGLPTDEQAARTSGWLGERLWDRPRASRVGLLTTQGC